MRHGTPAARADLGAASLPAPARRRATVAAAPLGAPADDAHTGFRHASQCGTVDRACQHATLQPGATGPAGRRSRPWRDRGGPFRAPVALCDARGPGAGTLGRVAAVSWVGCDVHPAATTPPAPASRQAGEPTAQPPPLPPHEGRTVAVAVSGFREAEPAGSPPERSSRPERRVRRPRARLARAAQTAAARPPARPHAACGATAAPGRRWEVLWLYA